MSPAFTDNLLYTTQTKLPEQFLEEIKLHIENDTLFHSAINTDEIINSFRSSKNGWIHYDNWIGGIIFGMMMGANKDYFHYDIEYFDAPIQAQYMRRVTIMTGIVTMLILKIISKAFIRQRENYLYHY